MDRTVVTILCTNYAGSHFLSLMVGSHSRAMHLGEIKHLAVPGRGHRNPCNLCDDPASCPLSRGIGPQTVDRVYDLVWENTGGSFPILVDNSKKVRWARRFAGRPPGRMKYLHLLRDPRALVRRWALTYERPGQVRHARWSAAKRLPLRAPRILAAPGWEVFVWKWLHQNQAITRFIRGGGRDGMVVTYRDLAVDRAGFLQRIMEWIGTPYEPGQEEYWRFPHHGSQKPGYAWMGHKGGGGHFDLRWQEDLPRSVQQRISANSAVRRYLERLGLRLEADGITDPLDQPGDRGGLASRARGGSPA